MANDAGNYTFGIDEAAMSVIALSCVRNQADVTSAMDLGVKYILNKKKNDGSFGNEYTTSLALQAFDAVSHPDLTGLKKNAISVLLKAMGEDGSFQSISAATHVMPVLANKTYADIRVICRKGTSAPMSTTTPGQPISFTITLQSTRLSPGTTRRFTVTTNNGTSLYYAMRELEAGEVGFSFTSRQTSWGVSITSLMGVASSSKERIYWQMLQSPSSPLTTTADKFYPNDGDDIIFRLVTYEGTLVG
ncbi:gastric intrinsic factor-like [Lingula anatina]|uniref:Gastric intrinsic factor-like n=1 Tax=Lingula anatina TaxID=7574 RepID=A0A1S3H083_LINAN|nr:gastric intrinsic factor-like [Lingula anatina]|eukprot:XP_013379535.1 gastric intrinsic factor-like [Lingula anatina]